MNTQPPTPSPARSPRPAMRSPLVFLTIAGAAVVAAGVGGYVAQSQRHVELPVAEARPAQPSASATAAPARPSVREAVPAAAGAAAEDSAPSPVATESPVTAGAPTPVEVEPAPSAPRRATTAAREPIEKPRERTPADAPRPERVAAASPAPSIQAPPPARTAEPAPAVEAPPIEAPAAADATPPAPAEPTARPQAAQVTIADTFVVPADSVIGLEIEHSVSSETAQPEDRVDARVTRDVKIDGAVVIPAGSRVRGAVTRVESGGRFKERGRIEIRFHTLILPDGDTQSIATDTLFREGENVGRRTGARIGATAAGGAIIGAIFGGEKGAAIGAAAGAGAGTAVTAAQKPSEARFRAGSVVTVRLAEPVSITVQQ